MPKTPLARLFHDKTRFSPRLRRFVVAAGLCALVLPITGFWAAENDAQRGITAVRMRIDSSAGPSPALRQAEKNASGNYLAPFALHPGHRRAALRSAPGPQEPPAAHTVFASANTNMIALMEDQAVLALADGTRLPLRRISRATPSQTHRFWQKSGSFLPADGRHRDTDPNGTSWLIDPNWRMGAECETRMGANLTEDMQRLLVRIRAPFSAKSHPKSAQYMEHIDHSSRKFGLSPQLVYAIMRTESAFNPFAVSNAGALGLMQVVPQSAGNEVRAFLTGKAEKPTSAFLFDPESNIEYGCAYLHLLSVRYFSGVRNQAARELCMIAGYNAGPRAVLRVFNSNPESAVEAINALSPEDLYDKLSSSMPAQETRLYIGKVLSAISSYPG